MRNNTERPETLDLGCNILVGADAERIYSGFKEMLGKTKWEHPYGERVSDRIIKFLKKDVL